MPNKTIITAEPDQLDIHSTREFDAPRELVYQAYVDPNLLAKWLWPGEGSMTMDSYEVSHGNPWRYFHLDGSGKEWAFRGVFHGDPSPDSGILQTLEYEGEPGNVWLEGVKFIDLGNGRSRIDMLSVYQSQAARDAVIAGGMQDGLDGNFLKLDAILAEQ